MSKTNAAYGSGPGRGNAGLPGPPKRGKRGRVWGTGPPLSPFSQPRDRKPRAFGPRGVPREGPGVWRLGCFGSPGNKARGGKNAETAPKAGGRHSSGGKFRASGGKSGLPGGRKRANKNPVWGPRAGIFGPPRENPRGFGGPGERGKPPGAGVAPQAEKKGSPGPGAGGKARGQISLRRRGAPGVGPHGLQTPRVGGIPNRGQTRGGHGGLKPGTGPNVSEFFRGPPVWTFVWARARHSGAVTLGGPWGFGGGAPPQFRGGEASPQRFAAGGPRGAV